MNNDQFDNLTRTMANGISRRDSLKLLGAGILSVLFGQFASGETEVLAAEVTCPTKGNKVVGNCDELTACIKRGVWYEGKYHEKHVGLTDPNFFATTIPSPAKLSMKKDTKSCDSQSVCGYSGFCLTLATEPIASFTANPVMTWLTWTPKGSMPSGCDTAIQSWQQRIIAHEERHRADDLRSAEKVSNDWNANKPYYAGCGSSPEAAFDELKADINADMTNQINLMRAEQAKRSCDFHISEGALIASPCRCDACNTASGLPQACGDQCCDPCSICENGICKSTCEGCTSCQEVTKNSDTYACKPVTCCTGCTSCNPDTKTCESSCTPCQTCEDGACVDLCGPGMHCENGSCVTNCTDCQAYDSATNTCISTCLDCETCENGTCVPVDCACQGITCDECMHCENGLCVRTCTDTEVCCGGQCINPSEYNCCITRDNGSFPCLNGSVCCASGECCDPAFGQCCGGVCEPYSTSHCIACFPCTGVVCCTDGRGSVYGCCDANQTCDPAHGCVANPN